MSAGALLAAMALMCALAAGASAQGTKKSNLLVTFVARVCPTYTDITANRARNDIQESLRDLGEDTPYTSGQAIDPAIEAAHQPNCSPLPGWVFTLGTGYRTKAVSGPWGALSVVTGAYPGAVTTLPSTPLLDPSGQATGESIAGAATIELTQAQAEQAARGNSLWVQGGTPTDPILNQPHPGEYGFGALRCALDNLNGDNVEWVGFPSGARHVFCYAYYVQPPPTSGTIIIRKQIQAPAGTSESFVFQGNLTFNSNGMFNIPVASGQTSAQQTFIRGQVRPGEPPWIVQELVPPNWRLSGLACVSQTGQSPSVVLPAEAEATIVLAASDTVTCTYTDEFVPPPGGLLIRKVTYGATGSFGFTATPSGGGAAASATAETTHEGEAVDATPSPLSLNAGQYSLSETSPSSDAGRWSLSAVNCDGQELALTQPISVSIVSGAGTVCTLTNTFVPLGSITLAKVTQGALATTGFLITPTSGTPFELHQSARTTHEGVAATATGDPSNHLELGRYLIQETTPEPVGTGQWELTSVQCGGHEVPFANGQAAVTLSEKAPDVRCVFTNTHRTTPLPPIPPGPGPEQADISVAKHAMSSQVTLGSAITYVLTVHNAGPGRAEDVVVDDQPSGPATLLRAHPTQGTCGVSLPLRCLIGQLDRGATAEITVVLLPHTAGTLTNEAIAGTSSPDPDYSGNLAYAHVHVVRRSTPHVPSFTG